MTATMDEAADLASAASPRLHCGLRQSIDAVSSADMEFGEPLVLPSQFTFAELSKQPAQRSYRDELVAGSSRHIPMQPLPPETSDLPVTL